MINYNRRRNLFNLNKSGGGELLFPISLVEGYNSEQGILLYNFLEANCDNDEYGSKFYEFKDGEIVTFSAFGLTHTVDSMFAYSTDNHIWRCNMSTFGNNTFLLESDGKVSVNWS